MWREGRVHDAVYTLALLYGLRIFFESIETFPEGWIILLFAVLVIRAGRVALGPSARILTARQAAIVRPPVSA
jgi:hypothetical protein